MNPRSPGRRRSAALLCLGLFALVSALESSGATHDWDIAALQWFGGWRSPGLTGVMQMLSNAGQWYVEVPLAFCVATFLWRRGLGRMGRRYVGVCLGGEAVYAVAKMLFHRERPTVLTHLSDAGWYSYPSGHAMLAPIVWTMGLLLVALLVSNRVARDVLTALAVIMPLAIATSRVYLGVHYLTDVLGGLALGAAWVLIWWDAVRRAPTAVVSTTQ